MESPPRPTRRRAQAWPLLGLALFLTALMALPRAGGNPDSEAAAVVARLLAQDAAQEAAVLRSLCALGRNGLDPMFAALLEDRLPGDPGRVVPLSDSQRALLRRAMAASEPGLLRAFLTSALERDPVPRAFLETLLVFGPRARSQDQRFLIDTAARGLERGGDPQALFGACEEALAGVLVRSPRSQADLPGLWRSSPSGFQAVIAGAVTRAGDPAGLRFLAGLLGATDEQDGLVLAAMTQLVSHPGLPASDDVCEPLRRLLAQGGAARIQSAAILLGKLGDEEAIPWLIEALENDSRGVQNQAGRALEEITGLSFRNEPRRWRAWYEEELAWFEERGESALEALHSEQEQEVFEAVRTLARRRLHRQEIAEELSALLAHDSVSLRRVVPGALAQIGSAVAVPALIDTLDDPDPDVARIGWKALEALTGLDLPLDPEAWRSAVREPR